MKVLVLAGGFDQIALINELKSRGHEVVLADYFENPPAKRYADKHIQASTLDEEKIYEIAKAEKVELITTACTDQALLTVAKVSERLGLPCYISYQKGLKVTNKEYMKKVFVENEIPTSKYFLIKDLHEVENILEKVQFPMVVKPCDCNSSKGVIKVKNEEELREHLANALELSRTSTAIIEEFKEGIELSVDVWVDKEGAKVLSASTTSKNRLFLNTFTIYQSKYPVEINEKSWSEIRNVAQKIAKAFEIENSPMLIQLIVNNDEVSVIEFSARMGGGTKYKLIEEMSGINIMRVYTNRILGDEEQIINPIPSKKNIELNYVYARNGVYDRLVNFEELKNKGIIKDYFVYKEAGSKIEKATTSSDRIVGFLIEDDTREALLSKRRDIVQQVEILDINGKPMMFKEIFNEEIV